MSKVYVCADLHFNHGNIIKYENRPFADKIDMNEQLVKNWNSVVNPDDVVWVLGDVAFASKSLTKELVGKLNGHKRLIMGNHDRSRNEKFWLEAGFEWVSRYPVVYTDNVILMHEPPDPIGKYGYSFCVYGHVHGDPAYANRTEHSACVSIERLGYKPALLSEVMNGTAYGQVD